MIVIDTNKCVGCGICTTICPGRALQAWWGNSEVDPCKCTDCFGERKSKAHRRRLCVEYCPVQAISPAGCDVVKGNVHPK